MDENTENTVQAIYVVQNGEAVMFGNTAGGSKEVYTFDTEAEFNAAIEAGTIPDGALVVKTYDGDEVPEGLESVEKVAMDDQVVVKQDDISKLATIQVIKDSVKLWDGKNLGNGVTSKQWAEIGAGTFYGMSPVDYWEIGGIKYRYMHTNYWLNTGDVPCTTPHIAIAPDTSLYNAPMNDTDTADGGYVGSKMRQTGLTQALTMAKEVFGENHILNHRELLINAVTNGIPSGRSWYDSQIELMNECMVYGTYVYNAGPQGTHPLPIRYTIDTTQLSVFFLSNKLICNRSYWWLRDNATGERFCAVGDYGESCDGDAHYSLGVRPIFGICA